MRVSFGPLVANCARSAHTRSKRIGEIRDEIRAHDPSEVGDYVLSAFFWLDAAHLYPEMTSTEIASMAADGFEVP